MVRVRHFRHTHRGPSSNGSKCASVQTLVIWRHNKKARLPRKGRPRGMHSSALSYSETCVWAALTEWVAAIRCASAAARRAWIAACLWNSTGPFATAGHFAAMGL